MKDGRRLLSMIESEAALFSDINGFAGWVESVCRVENPLKAMNTEALEKLYHQIGVELRERDSSEEA